MERRKHHLEALIVPKKRFCYANRTLYRVYDTPTHYQLIDAETAAEAFLKSGLQKAHKIQREAYFHYIALNKESITQNDEVIAVDIELPTEAEKRIFLDAALVDAAVEKSRRHFEDVPVALLHRKIEMEAPTPAVAVAAQEEAIKAPQSAAPAEDKDPDSALTTREINALLAAQEG